MKAHRIVLWWVVATAAADAQDVTPWLPEQVDKCLKRPEVSTLVVLYDQNPFYLRGDFDGDGKPDYAVAVRGSKAKRNGVLVCTGGGGVFLLGADNVQAQPFSDLPEDNFLGADWEVLTRARTLEMRQWTCTVPHPLPKILGETIAFIFEGEGTSIIYWDGSRFRWAGARQCWLPTFFL